MTGSSPPPGLSWLDVGAGNGAFTALLADRVKPASILGVDPSPAQLDYARKRTDVGSARFEKGHAMELPAADASVDAAVMALVIAFVPEPAKGVAEMARAVKPGGLVAGYMWDWPEGFPFYCVEQVISGRGLPIVAPPSAEASRKQRMHELWQGAGLADVESRAITAQRTFPDFDAVLGHRTHRPAHVGAGGPALTRDAGERCGLTSRRCSAPRTASPLTLTATANAVKGRVPG